jgi:hypothetical protein
MPSRPQEGRPHPSDRALPVEGDPVQGLEVVHQDVLGQPARALYQAYSMVRSPRCLFGSNDIHLRVAPRGSEHDNGREVLFDRCQKRTADDP